MFFRNVRVHNPKEAGSKRTTLMDEVICSSQRRLILNRLKDLEFQMILTGLFNNDDVVADALLSHQEFS
jgi:hypothetical protein